MKRLFLVLALSLFFACSKKTDNPTPAPSVQVATKVTPVIAPYYARLYSQELYYNSVACFEIFLGHNDSHTPKADKYGLVYGVAPNKNDTLIFNVWWSNNVPYSDYLYFKPATTTPLPTIPWTQSNSNTTGAEQNSY